MKSILRISLQVLKTPRFFTFQRFQNIHTSQNINRAISQRSIYYNNIYKFTSNSETGSTEILEEVEAKIF